MAKKKPKGKVLDNKIKTKFGLLVINVNFFNDVSTFLAHGVNQTSLLNYYGMTGSQWRALIKKFPVLEMAVVRGKVDLTYEISSLLIQKAREGNVSAMIFYLKSQAGFKDSGAQEAAADKPDVNFTINTIDPMEASRLYQKIMTGS